MDSGSDTKALRMLQAVKKGSRPLSPRGKEGSPSPYDFCNTSRSDDEDDDLHSEADESSSRGQRHEDSFSDGDSSVRSTSGREPPTGGKYLNIEKGVHHHEQFGVQSEYSEGTDEGAFANSFYGPLYQKSISSEQEDAPLDIENNMSIWDPPPPEDEVDETAIDMGDDDDNDTESFWGPTHSFGSVSSSEYRNTEKAATEEQRQAIREVVSGHFRVLVAQLLHGEGIQTEEACQQSWLEIVTTLSLEAANYVKPDTSRSGGMDPGGYVKVKYVATGKPKESQVVKGIVCKKNVAHRRMTSHYKNPRLLLLGGALEFQEHFASLKTMLQQETDHLSMAVARIEACHPNVLIVEKNVYRKAQEQLLTKEISLVLNVKRPLLERIARCSGGSVIPCIDHLSAKSMQLGFCELFHVEKYLEELDSTGQDGKKPTKTLMFFEGCPKPLGCTILLKGARSEELIKVKRAVQFAVFAAYHLARETSFLVDEGVNLPELCLKSPLSVALPDKKSKSDMSISTVSGFLAPSSSQFKNVMHVGGISSANALTSVISKESPMLGVGDRFLRVPSHSGLLTLSGNSSLASSRATSPLSSPFAGQETSNHAEGAKPWMTGSNSLLRELYGATLGKLSLAMTPEDVRKGYLEAKALDSPRPRNPDDGPVTTDSNSHLWISESSPKSPLRVLLSSEALPQDQAQYILLEGSSPVEMDPDLHANNQDEDGQEYLREEFPPSPSDHQSILVSFSSSCLRKGTVCQRGHLFRIKYYGTFDNPLGRFLRDTVFDLTKKCSSCGEAKDAHVDCYTHRQGSLTISVHKQNQPLPGESEGKIWMWHRCLKCARIKGMPPTTRRLVMSDAAWGLSFGKFLELSFSNHAAASRVASCGHSLHRDCLRFYGFGRLVACFRYSPVNVYSVYLPPSKLEFHYSEHQDWLQQEIQEIAEKGELCFKDVFDHLHQINEKASGYSSGKASETKRRLAEMEGLAIKHKTMFKAALHCAASASSHRTDQPHIDILQLNYIRRCLSKCSSTWSSSLQRFLPSLKPLKADIVADLLGDSLMSVLQDVSFGIGRSCKSDDGKEASTFKDLSLDGASSELFQGPLPIPTSNEEDASGGLGSLSKVKMSDSLNGFEITSFSDAVASARSSGSSTLSSEVACDVDVMARGGENGITRTLSEGQFPTFGDLSATFDAAWTGQGHGSLDEGSSHKSVDETWVSSEGSGSGSKKSSPEALDEGSFRPRKLLSLHGSVATGFEPQFSSTLMSPAKAGVPSDIEGWVGEPYSKLCRPYGESTSMPVSESAPMEDPLRPTVSPFVAPQASQEATQEEARMCFPVGIDDAMVSVHDDEPTSVIAFAITSQEHKAHVADRFNRSVSDLFELSESSSDQGDRDKSSIPEEGSHPRAHNTLPDDPLLYARAMHMKVSFTDDAPRGKVSYTVTCYYAKQFDGLRRKCCPNAVDFIRSLCRCKKWGAQGGKSNVFFAKTVDDRFVVKQVTRTELDSFMTFAPAYFKYIYEALISGSPTCLAKILGIYQVTVKHGKAGKEVRMDLMIMENLLYGRHVTRVYDLKGSLRSRYNSDVTGKNAVLLDQNLLESMQTNPIFISNKSKRSLERAVWNDTAFLASVDVMDYSLLVGIDEERNDLVLGIIDFMRQYTWDKHLETWVKASGILGGPKNAAPTIISPMQYKKRFRKAMSTYFLMVPDQWSPLTLRADKPLIEPADENSSATVQDAGAMDEFDIG